MPAGLGASGYMAVTLETTMGTYLPPTTAGTVFIPIISESLAYSEDAYYATPIMQSTVANSREQGYYHVEGDIVLDVEAWSLPYLLHCSRHNIAKSGAGPYVYTYTPSQAGSASTAASGNVPRTASITIVRNGVGFGYAGCVMNTLEFTLESGVLRGSFGVLGLSEAQPGGLGTPSWSTPSYFGAAAHSVYVDAAGTAPAFAAADLTFNGWTSNYNYNGAAQNRIIASRSAAYISFGETEATYTTELDFMSRTEYDNFKNNTRRAIKFESIKGGATFALATEGVQQNFFNTAYDAYPVNLGGIGDLVMASGVVGRILNQSGGSPYSIVVKGSSNIL